MYSVTVPRPPALPYRQRGLNLIELMIGVTLGLMVMVSLGYILLGSRSSFSIQDANSRVQETGRLVMEVLSRDLRFAGRISLVPVSGSAQTEWPTNINPLEGTEGSSGAPDSITIRYQLDNTGGATIEDCNGAEVEVARVPIQDGFEYDQIVNQYFISSNSLSCLGNGNASSQPLADNVEDLQIMYGVDTDSDSAPNQYLAANNVTAWQQVISVRICALIRSDTGAVNGGQAYVDCSGNSATSTDTRLRRSFVTVVNLRNRNMTSQ